jgi:hypothetical protein
MKSELFAFGLIAGVIFAFACIGYFFLSPSPPPGRPPLASEPPASRPPDRHTIDRILEKLELGNIAFNTPKTVNLRDTALIELKLNLNTPIEKLKQMIQAAGEKDGARIQVSDRMEARLTGSNFSITAVTPEVQAVSRRDTTEWKWEVKPSSAGKQYLHLTLSAFLSVDGMATPRAIRTFDKIIEVQVTWSQQVSTFFEDNWQWLWATLLVPIGGYFWKKKKSTSEFS